MTTNNKMERQLAQMLMMQQNNMINKNKLKDEDGSMAKKKINIMRDDGILQLTIFIDESEDEEKSKKDQNKLNFDNLEILKPKMNRRISKRKKVEL